MARKVATNASDPSVDGRLLAWHEAGQPGILVDGGRQARTPGAHPALGGGRLAVVNGAQIDVHSTTGDGFATSVPAPGADHVAVSAEWLVWRAREGATDVLYGLPLAGGSPIEIIRAAEVGRPAVLGGLAAFHLNTPRQSRIVLADLASNQTSTVRSERRALLLNPALEGRRLLYVRTTYKRQELRLGSQSRRSPFRDRMIFASVPTGRRDAGHEPGIEHHQHGQPHKLWKRPRAGVSATLWTTALAADFAYVTRLRQVAGQPLVAELLRVER
jgi:hypothetical protein